MPNIKSAKKRVLVTEKKNATNRSDKAELKTAIKKMNAVIEAGNYDEALALLPATMSIIDAAASKGLIHKNNAAHKKSAISKKVNALKA